MKQTSNNPWERFRDWVNADDHLPTVEELEQARAQAAHHSVEDPPPSPRHVHPPTVFKDDEIGALGLGDVAKESTLDHMSPEEVQEKFNYFRTLSNVAIVALVLLMVGVLMGGALKLPLFGGATNPTVNQVYEEYVVRGPQVTGATNMVAGMILDYRAFDTLGESVMLFTATIGVLMLLYRPEEKEKDFPNPPMRPIILQVGVKVLTPMILLYGLYIIVNGHLSPGGGFSGGAIVGAGLSLYASAFGIQATQKFFNMKVFTLISAISLGFYALAKGFVFYMGGNGKAVSIPTGTLGNILSGGLILPLNICVGLVVASTIYCFYSLFLEGDV